MTERESLRIITEMISSSKSNLRENTVFYLLWGWLVLAASLLHFILIQAGYRHAYLPWPVLMIAGTVVSVFIAIRMGRKATVRTYTDTMMIYLWWGFFMTVVILMSFAFSGRLSWGTAHPLIVSLYGLGTFVSGGVLKFRPLILGGMACWVIALSAFFIPADFMLLMIALSVIVAYLIPGYMLQSKN